jgi:hypothetical protein
MAVARAASLGFLSSVDLRNAPIEILSLEP